MTTFEDSQQEGRSLALVEGGAELFGASAGAAVGLIGGPPGAFGGALAGVAVTRVLRHVGSELYQRLLGPRERIRVGAAFTHAAEAIALRLAAGDRPRSDGFFDETSAGRPAAEELLEGVLKAAGDAYEEQKVPFLGNLYAGIAFDADVDRAHANFLIGLARALTFRQLVVMAVLLDGDTALVTRDLAKRDPPKILAFDDELSLEVDELERLGLVGRGEPGGTPKRGGMTFVDAGSLSPSALTLTGPGKRLYELMGLRDVEPEARREVLDTLLAIAPHN